MPTQVILASASPRRKELLERMGFTVKTVPSNVVELRDENESPENYVKRMARAKVLSVVDRLRATLYGEAESPRARRSGGSGKDSAARWVIGADTVVVVGEQILEKPKDNAEALAMLTALSGREHLVVTGFCLFDLVKGKEGIQAVTTAVRFKRFKENEAERYVSTGESMDKAGAYAIQGIGAYLVESIDGSYTNVVGLPLCQIIEMMQEMGTLDVP